MADRLDPVAVGVQHKSPIVTGVVTRPQCRLTIVMSAIGERRLMEIPDGFAISGAETEVHAR